MPQKCPFFGEYPTITLPKFSTINTVIMQLKHLFLTFCLLANTFLNATSTPPMEFSGCNAPAPGNFQTTLIGSSSVDLSWNFEAQATGGYTILTRRASDGVQVNATNKLQNELTATIANLTQGEEYISDIYSRCEDGSQSQLKTSVSYKILILELIVSGYTPPSCLNTVCTISNIGSSNGCSFLNGSEDGSTYFRISKPGTIPRDFEVYYVSVGNYKFGTGKSNADSASPFDFFCSNNIPDNCTGSNSIIVKANNQTVATLKVSFGTNTASSILYCETLSPTMIVERLTACPTRSAEQTESVSLTATASPNPFSETLEVKLGQVSQSNVQLQLYNLSGQKVLGLQFTGNQAQYSLPTSSLSPGFYFLRIEADSEVQTLKVIKSE